MVSIYIIYLDSYGKLVGKYTSPMDGNRTWRKKPSLVVFGGLEDVYIGNAATVQGPN